MSGALPLLPICRHGVDGEIFTLNFTIDWGTALQAGRSRVRFPMGSFKRFHLPNPSDRTMALT